MVNMYCVRDSSVRFLPPFKTVNICLLLALAETGCVSTAPRNPEPELLTKLAQRDREIENLMKRVQVLEQHNEPSPVYSERPVASTTQATPARTLPEPVPPAAPPSELKVATNNVARSSAAPAPTPSIVPQEKLPPLATKKASEPNGSTARNAPKSQGMFDVDEDAAQRALERTLVISGALLVPYGQFEVQPAFSYQHYSAQLATLANLPRGGAVLANTYDKTDAIGGNVFMRLGMPFDSQLEINTPYQSRDSEVTTLLSTGQSQSINKGGNGFGDLQLGVAKTLLTEKNWWPDVIARLTWDSDTGQTPNLIPLGTGFNELQGTLTMTKRQDPLVFLGSVGYQSAFAKNNLRPGDSTNFSLGTFLGASPETSLRMILTQSFVNGFEVNGKSVAGSGRNFSILNFGASTVLGKGMFIDFTAGVGLTKDAPDYTVGASFAKRFDLPFMPPL